MGVERVRREEGGWEGRGVPGNGREERDGKLKTVDVTPRRQNLIKYH